MAAQIETQWIEVRAQPELEDLDRALTDALHLAPKLVLDVIEGLEAPDSGGARRTAVASLSRFSVDLSRYVFDAISVLEAAVVTTTLQTPPTTTQLTARAAASTTAPQEAQETGTGFPIGWILLGVAGALLAGRRST